MLKCSYVVIIRDNAKNIANLITSLKAIKGNFRKEFIFIDDGSSDDSLSTLKNETKESFSKVATEITKSNDYLRLAIEDINRFSVLTLVTSIAAGAISGTCIFVILLYLN